MGYLPKPPRIIYLDALSGTYEVQSSWFVVPTIMKQLTAQGRFHYYSYRLSRSAICKQVNTLYLNDDYYRHMPAILNYFNTIHPRHKPISTFRIEDHPELLI